MLSFTVIGCGAAGNKAVIDLMGIGYNPKKCYLVNSTAKDIPEQYARSRRREDFGVAPAFRRPRIYGVARRDGTGGERSVGRHEGAEEARRSAARHIVRRRRKASDAGTGRTRGAIPARQARARAALRRGAARLGAHRAEVGERRT